MSVGIRRAQASSASVGANLVCRRDRLRVDQGLAVEAELQALNTGRAKAVRILEIQMDSVEDRKPMTLAARIERLNW